MKDLTQDTIKVDFKKRKIVATVWVHQFKEGDFVMKVIPTLDISAYGRTVEQAEEMLTETVKVYLTSLLKQGPSLTSEELRKYGFVPRTLLFPDRKEFSRSSVDADGNLKGFEIPSDAISAPMTF
ncbi:MAG: hypothetical protein ABIV51_14655 [Saprospiraceae bacterium]